MCSNVEGEGTQTRMSKVGELYVYDQFNKVSMDEVLCGDIVAISGIQVRAPACPPCAYASTHLLFSHSLHAQARPRLPVRAKECEDASTSTPAFLCARDACAVHWVPALLCIALRPFFYCAHHMRPCHAHMLGVQDVKIGETICAKEAPVALDTIKVPCAMHCSARKPLLPLITQAVREGM